MVIIEQNNGGWIELANVLKKFKSYNVIFSIDGLEKTYSIYRVNGNFYNIINNAQTFINAGGNAYWKYIVMKHNECNIQKALSLSKKMGFKRFFITKPRA